MDDAISWRADAHGPYRVLVVDDDVDIRAMVGMLLASEGYRVQTARHGAEALPLARAWHPHVILLDLNMPVMDGPTFRAHQRADSVCAGIPIIAMSAGDNIALWRASLEPCERVAKPFDVTDLVASVARCIAFADS